MAANLALLGNDARVGAQIAAALEPNHVRTVVRDPGPV
jgi:hypothetical protein